MVLSSIQQYSPVVFLQKHITDQVCCVYYVLLKTKA